MPERMSYIGLFWNLHQSIDVSIASSIMYVMYGIVRASFLYVFMQSLHPDSTLNRVLYFRKELVGAPDNRNESLFL